jgi:hypothetical protein
MVLVILLLLDVTISCPTLSELLLNVRAAYQYICHILNPYHRAVTQTGHSDAGLPFSTVEQHPKVQVTVLSFPLPSLLVIYSQ